MIYFLIVLFCIWLISFWFQNDLTIRLKNCNGFRKILIIYPHPDDEVLTCGGLIKSSQKSIITVLTKGEAGENYLNDNSNLKVLRTQEMQRSAKILGANKLINLDLGDGELTKKKLKIIIEVKKIIEFEKPDLVITYDLAGLYGHPDHVVLSEVITELRKKYEYALWYSTFPRKVLKMVKLPDHMANDKRYKNMRVHPTLKIFIGLSVFDKIKALYAHKSQYNSFRNAYPFKFIPLWVFVLGTIFEYFYEVK